MSNGDGNKSTQKLPRHHSYASQTQDSYSGESSPKYNNTDAGRGSRGKSDPDGGAPAAGPKRYTNRGGNGY